MWSQSRDGKVRYFERCNDPLTGKTKTVSCTMNKDTAANRKKAAAILQRKIEECCQKAAPPELLTLGSLVDRYALYQSKTIKNSTCVRNGYEAKAVLSMLGSDTLVERLTVSYVMEKLLAAGETATCTNARIKYIKALIRADIARATPENHSEPQEAEQDPA